MDIYPHSVGDGGGSSSAGDDGFPLYTFDSDDIIVLCYASVTRRTSNPNGGRRINIILLGPWLAR